MHLSVSVSHCFEIPADTEGQSHPCLCRLSLAPVVGELLPLIQQLNPLSVAVPVLCAGDEEVNKTQSLPSRSSRSHGRRTRGSENDLEQWELSGLRGSESTEKPGRLPAGGGVSTSTLTSTRMGTSQRQQRKGIDNIEKLRKSRYKGVEHGMGNWQQFKRLEEEQTGRVMRCRWGGNGDPLILGSQVAAM